MRQSGVKSRLNNKLYKTLKTTTYGKRVPIGWLDYENRDIIPEEDNLFELDTGRDDGMRILLLGKTGCLSGETLIMCNGESMPIGSAPSMFTTKAYDFQKQLAVDTMAILNKTGRQKVYAIEFDSGKRVLATKNHKFYTEEGWKETKALKDGLRIFMYGKRHNTEGEAEVHIGSSQREIPNDTKCTTRSGIGYYEVEGIAHSQQERNKKEGRSGYRMVDGESELEGSDEGRRTKKEKVYSRGRNEEIVSGRTNDVQKNSREVRGVICHNSKQTECNGSPSNEGRQKKSILRKKNDTASHKSVGRSEKERTTFRKTEIGCSGSLQKKECREQPIMECKYAGKASEADEGNLQRASGEASKSHHAKKSHHEDREDYQGEYDFVRSQGRTGLLLQQICQGRGNFSVSGFSNTIEGVDNRMRWGTLPSRQRQGNAERQTSGKCRLESDSFHGEGDSGKIIPSEVVKSVKFYGYDETYDLTIPNHHNYFLANGILVHNSGKTWLLRGMMNRMSLAGNYPIIMTDIAPEYYTSMYPLQEEFEKFILEKETPQTFKVKMYYPFFLYNYSGIAFAEQNLFQFDTTNVKPDDLIRFANLSEMPPRAKNEMIALLSKMLLKRSEFKSIDDVIKFFEEKEDMDGESKKIITRIFKNLKDLGVFGSKYPAPDLIQDIKDGYIPDLNLFGWANMDFKRYVALYIVIMLNQILSAKREGRLRKNKHVITIFEELQEFAPKGYTIEESKAITRTAIRNYVRTGRKDMCSFVGVTQTPTDLDPVVVEQMDYIIVPYNFDRKKVMEFINQYLPNLHLGSNVDFQNDMNHMMAELKAHRDGNRDWLVIDINRKEIKKITPLGVLSQHRVAGR